MGLKNQSRISEQYLRKCRWLGYSFLFVDGDLWEVRLGSLDWVRL